MKHYYLWQAKDTLEYFLIVALVNVYAVWKDICFLNLGITVYWAGVAVFMIYCVCRHRSFQKQLQTAKQTFVGITPTKVRVCLESYNSKRDRAKVYFECDFEENGQLFRCHSESYMITWVSSKTNQVDYDGIELKQMPQIWIYPQPETGKYLVEVQPE